MDNPLERLVKESKVKSRVVRGHERRCSELEVGNEGDAESVCPPGVFEMLDEMDDFLLNQ